MIEMKGPGNAPLLVSGVTNGELKESVRGNKIFGELVNAAEKEKVSKLISGLEKVLPDHPALSSLLKNVKENDTAGGSLTSLLESEMAQMTQQEMNEFVLLMEEPLMKKTFPLVETLLKELTEKNVATGEEKFLSTTHLPEKGLLQGGLGTSEQVKAETTLAGKPEGVAAYKNFEKTFFNKLDGLKEKMEDSKKEVMELVKKLETITEGVFSMIKQEGSADRSLEELEDRLKEWVEIMDSLQSITEAASPLEETQADKWLDAFAALEEMQEKIQGLTEQIATVFYQAKEGGQAGSPVTTEKEKSLFKVAEAGEVKQTIDFSFSKEGQKKSLDQLDMEKQLKVVHNILSQLNADLGDIKNAEEVKELFLKSWLTENRPTNELQLKEMILPGASAAEAKAMLQTVEIRVAGEGIEQEEEQVEETGTILKLDAVLPAKTEFTAEKPVNVQELKEAVSRDIEKFANVDFKYMNANKINFIINPEHLGRVEVTIEKKGNELVVEVTVENQDMLEKVDSLMNEIKNELKEKQIDVSYETELKREKEQEEKRKEPEPHLKKESKREAGEDSFSEKINEILGGRKNGSGN